MLSRLWLALSGILGFLAVGLAAYASHGLPQDEHIQRMAQSALTMQGWHALALFGIHLLAERRSGAMPHYAGACFFIGTVMFAGAIWSLVLQGVSLGRVAPIGGMLLMLGWIFLAFCALPYRPKGKSA
ncbi:DUF423 domain-containing protein [Acetobacteraceae bacterium H6797]|nr:DUF423 domain-containing protein [Acetobacteraceae bacterium H6797]